MKYRGVAVCMDACKDNDLIVLLSILIVVDVMDELYILQSGRIDGICEIMHVCVWAVSCMEGGGT